MRICEPIYSCLNRVTRIIWTKRLASLWRRLRQHALDQINIQNITKLTQALGELAAANYNTGDIAWRIPFGRVDALEAKGVMNRLF